MNRYLRVKWSHQFADEPVAIYSEIDDGNWELRKIEVFPDGRMDFAGDGWQRGQSNLSKEPLPSNQEIAADPQFLLQEIEFAEFQGLWEKAIRVYQTETGT